MVRRPVPGWLCLLVIGLVGTQLSVVAQQNWCDISLNHTLCKYTTTSPACGERVNFGVDGILREYIVSLHNIRRAKVAAGGEKRGAPGPQPAASKMNKLKWNEDLALIAQRWADQCTFATDSVRNASLTGAGGTVVYVGQNIYAYLDSAATFIRKADYPEPSYWEQAINSWYNEVQLFNKNNVNSYVYQAPVGHYTQLVWGDTTDVGCGFTQWVYTNGRFARILVCDYGIGGNKVGTPVYAAVASGSQPCGGCPAGTCEGFLCSPGSGAATAPSDGTQGRR